MLPIVRGARSQEVDRRAGRDASAGDKRMGYLVLGDEVGTVRQLDVKLRERLRLLEEASCGSRIEFDLLAVGRPEAEGD